MGNIRVMPEALANQIAAGEVVERPASCVKELIENSLDAGAKSIHVSLQDGGISRIVVQDDGTGMDEQDALIAFSRHATSKLTHARDLIRIATLGFRGEALASIAAVARVTLQTRTTDADHGIELVVEGSAHKGDPVPVGMPRGTRIDVRDLFYNLPARLKYLRTVATEQARCVDVVQRAALSRPDVSFRCEADGHSLFQSTGSGKTVEVLAALYGVGEAKQFIHVKGATADYRVEGWVGRPTQGRSSRSHGHLFINQRPIRNIAVHGAIVAGYQSRLMVNKHPMYTLYIEMDPTLVDVNIHPHKAEVRFSEERDLVQLLQARVKAALDETFLVHDVRVGAVGTQPRERTVQTGLAFRPSVPATGGEASSGRGGDRPLSPPTRQPVDEPRLATGRSDGRDLRATITRDKLDTVYEPQGRPTLATPQPDAENRFEKDTAEPAPASRRPQDWVIRPIGQALGMYIIADDGDSLYIIDQHAAHERVLYERFSQQMNGREVHYLALLTPLSMSLSTEQFVAVQSHQETLAHMGLTFELFGGRDVLLRTIPDIWDGLDAAQLAEELLEELVKPGAKVDVRQSIREHIVSRSCKAAIKANRYMSEMEMNALCEALSGLEDPFHCPHGRPVFIRLTDRDLEKEFRRIV